MERQKKNSKKIFNPDTDLINVVRSEREKASVYLTDARFDPFLFWRNDTVKEMIKAGFKYYILCKFQYIIDTDPINFDPRIRAEMKEIAYGVTHAVGYFEVARDGWKREVARELLSKIE